MAWHHNDPDKISSNQRFVTILNVFTNIFRKTNSRTLPMTNPMATQACNDWTKGLDSSGPSIVFMRPLSETSKDPVPRVKMPNTENTNTFE